MSLTWRELPAADLDPALLYAVLRLRVDVFVVEQACPYPELDGLDLLPETRHLVALRSHENDRGGGCDHEVAAYSRLLAPSSDKPDSNAPAEARIGRVIVTAGERGRGTGHELIRRSVDACATHWPAASIRLGAQAHLQGYYGAHGFVACSEIYDEDGIDHIDMRLRPRPREV